MELVTKLAFLPLKLATVLKFWIYGRNETRDDILSKLENNKFTNQMTQIHMLICVLAVCTWKETDSLMV